MINNPTPITAQPFNGMWITHVGIFFPTTKNPKGLITGEVAPYDGTHLLRTGSKKFNVTNLPVKLTTDTQLNTVLNLLKAEVQQKANKTAAVTYVTVNALDPAKAVLAQAGFVDGTSYIIKDCFTLAGTDAVFANVFTTVMGEIAIQAGLTVS